MPPANLRIALWPAPPGEEPHRLAAFLDGVEVGSLEFENDGDGTAFVAYVTVAARHRRRGIATAMADYLRDQIGLLPTFAPADGNSGNSAEGDAWIRAYQSRNRSGG